MNIFLCVRQQVSSTAFLRSTVLPLMMITLAVIPAHAFVLAQEFTVPDIVIPYTPDEPALRADQVFLRHDQFLQLYQQAHPRTLEQPTSNPLGSRVIAAFLKSGVLTPVAGEKQTLSFEARFVVCCDSDSTVSVPLPVGPVAIRAVQVDGSEGTVRPLLTERATEPQNTSNQQIQRPPLAATSTPPHESSAYSVQVTGEGLHVVDLRFDIAAVVEGDVGRADLPLRSPPSGLLEWTLPADGLEAKIQGRTNMFRRDGRTILVPIEQLTTIRLQWLPEVQQVAGDIVFHATTASALAVQNSGLQLRTTVELNVRQGEVSDVEVTIPTGYSVQSVIGEDIAGWTAQSTDTTRSIKLQFRRNINDSTKVTLQLYADAPSPEALASLVVPISVVRGASRDLGTVVLKTGPQFQVRSDSLSAVTQIDPGEAPVPEGEELAGRPMLAWRYTRHPASVSVKVTPTADELSAESIHAVRLEEQRELWSSRMTLLISGAPRSRIDIAVPKDFLALDINATALKDWYFSDAVDGDVANEEIRILSLQLLDARSGQLQIAIQGQMSRDVDRSLLQVQPPTVLNATRLNSELAVWLDAASESAGIESGVGNGSDWTAKSVAAAHGSYREISPTAPSLVFTSEAIRPGVVAVKLRQAVSTLIGESVTVTNVTQTAIEITLALNWTINRAAADQFAVDLPGSMASVMSFEVPGQRRVSRAELADGKTRITLQLQQPVTDRLFVLGTASLPLPDDKIIRGVAPEIVVPQGAPSTMSGQAHYWVLVNQSNGLLQPSQDQPEIAVGAEQITTQIPPQLLQQAVAVVRLRPETANWNLVYPEQFQVAPAVVNLATHTTVLSDDGSWRSRHQLEVTNESRQFLPVILPPGSRVMYCLVQGRPSRVVVRREGETERHLIPIPQSGALAAGYEVEFALAGRFEDSVARVQEGWNSRELKIPVPIFPEFRDDPEFGISVSRNRWSVYVPDSWQAALVEDPSATNVVEAADDDLEDASLLSDVEQAAALLKSAKNAKGLYLRSKVLEQVQNATDRLNRSFGNDLEVEQQRGLLLDKLSDLNSEYQMEDESLQRIDVQAGQKQLDNRFLYEADAVQNFGNSANVDMFWSFNAPRSGATFGQPKENEADLPENLIRDRIPDRSLEEQRFRFEVNIQDKQHPLTKQQSPAGDDSRRKNGELKHKDAEEKAPADKAMSDEKLSEKETLSAGKGIVEGRSRLLQRRNDRLEPGGLSEQMDGVAVQREQSMVQSEVQLGLPLNSLEEQQSSTPAPQSPATATPTGLLSLRFEIPTDGHRIDFLRVGGNPELALNVRSAESVHDSRGLIWFVLCMCSLFMLPGPGRRGQTMIFLQRLCIIVTIAGLSAWLMTVGDLRTIGLFCSVLGGFGIAVFTVARSFRRV